MNARRGTLEVQLDGIASPVTFIWEEIESLSISPWFSCLGQCKEGETAALKTWEGVKQYIQTLHEVQVLDQGHL